MQSPAKAREAALSDRIEQAICGAAELAKACEARFHASESRFEELSFATDAQVKQLVTDVEMQRAQDEKLLLAIDGAYHSMELLRSELHTQEAEMGRIKEELRLKEEATTRALAKADEERRAAQVGLHEHIIALTDHVSAMDRNANVESATIRAEVAKQAASREAEVVAIREEYAAGVQELGDSLRTMDEEQTRRRAEDERKVMSPPPQCPAFLCATEGSPHPIVPCRAVDRVRSGECITTYLSEPPAPAPCACVPRCRWLRHLRASKTTSSRASPRNGTSCIRSSTHRRPRLNVSRRIWRRGDKRTPSSSESIAKVKRR